jgi:hypothetical protein
MVWTKVYLISRDCHDFAGVARKIIPPSQLPGAAARAFTSD